jgi:hypothetical protein
MKAREEKLTSSGGESTARAEAGKKNSGRTSPLFIRILRQIKYCKKLLVRNYANKRHSRLQTLSSSATQSSCYYYSFLYSRLRM